MRRNGRCDRNELMEQIHHEMSEMRLDLGEVKRELNVVRIHMAGMQSDIHNVYGVMGRLGSSPRPDRTAAGDRRICRAAETFRSAMKSAVVLLPGLNRDRDMIAALTKISAASRRSRVWQTETEIPDVDLIVIPGGFSYGDYLRCGAIAARMPVMRAVAENGPPGRAGHRRLQRLPDPGRGRPAAGRADAQRLAAIRLPRGQAQGRQRQHRVHPQLCARARSSAARSPIMTAIISPTPRRLRGSKAKARWCSAMPRAPIPTARSTISPASSTNGGNVLGLMPHPENLIEAAHGGTDGRALFESALGLAA